MRKTQILIHKPAFLGLSILHLSKTGIYEFWYDYVKPKYGEDAKPCYLNRGTFIVFIKTVYIYEYIAEDVGKIFDFLDYELHRPLYKRKNKKVVGLMKDLLGLQIMAKFVGLITKTYSYLKDNNNEGKKTKGTRESIIKRKLKLDDYKNFSELFQFEYEINILEKT